MSGDAKQCPWCTRWCLKDNACSYIFACGLSTDGRFYVGGGCGKSWCWDCGKKYCGLYCNPSTGDKMPNAKDYHNPLCCHSEPDFKQEEFCGGGCSSHCPKRW